MFLLTIKLEFRNKGTGKFEKNRRFLNRVYSLLPSCDPTSAMYESAIYVSYIHGCLNAIGKSQRSVT